MGHPVPFLRINFPGPVIKDIFSS